jgi:hypothetical protein
MNIRFANRGRAIEMRPAAGEIASHHQSAAEQRMPDPERDRRALPLSQRQALRRNFSRGAGVERHEVRHEETEEH